MSPPPQKLRELCLLALYSQSIRPDQTGHLTGLIARECRVSRTWAELGKHRASAVLHHVPELDSLIRAAALSFEFSRIGAVELAILRLGIYELFCDSAIPLKVALAESIRLARKFCSVKSGKFINAVLDQVGKGAQSERGQS